MPLVIPSRVVAAKQDAPDMLAASAIGHTSARLTGAAACDERLPVRHGTPGGLDGVVWRVSIVHGRLRVDRLAAHALELCTSKRLIWRRAVTLRLNDRVSSDEF